MIVFSVIRIVVSRDLNGGMRMQPTILQEIIVKLLVLTDAVLGVFVGPANYTANPASCGGATVVAGELTACGQALSDQIGTLIVQGSGLLASIFTAFSVT